MPVSGAISSWWAQALSAISSAYEEHSPLFLLFSAIIGGLFGGSFKLIFEIMFPDWLRLRREAHAAVRRYRGPLVRSADALRGRIQNFLAGGGTGWLLESEYYRLSTAYVFGAYFGWQQSLWMSLQPLQYESARRVRKLSIITNHIEKAFNNLEYFGDRDMEEIPEESVLPKFTCQALGDLMLTDKQAVLTFPAFCHRYNSDTEFRMWFANLDAFLTSAPDLLPDRLRVIMLALNSLIAHLDRRGEIAEPWKIGVRCNVLTDIYSERAREILLYDWTRKALPASPDRSHWSRTNQWIRIRLLRRSRVLPNWRKSAQPPTKPSSKELTGQ